MNKFEEINKQIGIDEECQEKDKYENIKYLKKKVKGRS
jgi:hypothetical protein